MRKSNEIAAALRAKYDALQAETDAAKRKALAAEVETLTDELRDAQLSEAAQRALLNQRVLGTPEQKELKRFSLAKFIREAATNRVLTGFELEMSQEAEKEMRSCGQTLTGFGIPSILLGVRTFDNNNVTTATEGAEFAAITNWSYVGALRDAMLGTKLGVRYIPGMQGDARIVKGGGMTATWQAEESSNTKQKASFSAVDMKPHGLQVYGGYTYDLLKQSSLDVERILWDDLVQAHAQALDAAIFKGTGTDGQPLGILNTSGIGSVAMGTNGGAISHAKIVELETAVGNANGLFGRLAYVTNSKVAGAMKTTPMQNGFPRFLMEEGRANGFDVHATNSIPSNLTKGSSSGVCSAMIFGNFEEVLAPQWGGLDMIVDPYTPKDKRVVDVTAIAYHDICVRRPACFAAIKDITTA